MTIPAVITIIREKQEHGEALITCSFVGTFMPPLPCCMDDTSKTNQTGNKQALVRRATLGSSYCPGQPRRGRKRCGRKSLPTLEASNSRRSVWNSNEQKGSACSHKMPCMPKRMPDEDDYQHCSDDHCNNALTASSVSSSASSDSETLCCDDSLNCGVLSKKQQQQHISKPMRRIDSELSAMTNLTSPPRKPQRRGSLRSLSSLMRIGARTA